MTYGMDFVLCPIGRGSTFSLFELNAKGGDYWVWYVIACEIGQRGQSGVGVSDASVRSVEELIREKTAVWVG